MEADGVPSTPLPLSVLCFTDIQGYSYMDQRKVEADVEVTEDRTGDLSLRKPRTRQHNTTEPSMRLKLSEEITKFIIYFFPTALS